MKEKRTQQPKTSLNFAKRRLALYGVQAVLLFLLVVMAFYWNEARKEIHFLCQNFKPGVSKVSVIRQLDTANLIHVEHNELPNGESEINATAPFKLPVYKCRVVFNTNTTVKAAYP